MSMIRILLGRNAGTDERPWTSHLPGKRSLRKCQELIPQEHEGGIAEKADLLAGWKRFLKET